MDCTPTKQANHCGGLTTASPSFYIPRIYKSTPNTTTAAAAAAAANDVSYLFDESYDEKSSQYELPDGINSSAVQQQSSKTLNESLTSQLKNINIERNIIENPDNEQSTTKYLKNNNSERIQTSPSTPDFYLVKSDYSNRKSSSGFKKFSPQCGIASPVKEILYPTLVPLEPLKKPLTPQKFKNKLNRIGQNWKPFGHGKTFTKHNYPSLPPITKILTVDVVMKELFSYLTDKELFRFAMVSNGCRDALLKNSKANERYQNYKKIYKTEKENYKITPPASPQNEGSMSPTSRLYHEFKEIGNCLSQEQLMSKCIKCAKPSIIEKSIAQCTADRCGYIYCTKCFSSSYSPHKFYDKCQGFTLGQQTDMKVRGKLEDLSNCSPDVSGCNSSSTSMLNSPANNHFFSTSSLFNSSGYYSGFETSHTSVSVRRNLNKTFNKNDISPFGNGKSQKPLFDSNRSFTIINNESKMRVNNQRRSINFVPVLSNGGPKFSSQIIDPPSPPNQIKSHVTCSKQSKRMLKRLTR